LALTALVNPGDNPAIAWLSLSGEHFAPMWSWPLVQPPGTVTDTLGTLAILSVFTTVLVSAAVRRDRRSGKLLVLEPPARWISVLRRLPPSALGRGLLFGGLCVGMVGPIALLAITSAGFDNLRPQPFIIYKALSGVTLGVIVTPVIALQARTQSAPDNG
jgi:hypothetical protein